MMTISQHIGIRIKAARSEAGLTQEQLADAISKSVETISNAERGRVLTSVETLEAMARALGVPLAFFFDEYRGGRDASSKSAGYRAEIAVIASNLNDRQLGLLLDLARGIERHD